jgi:multisubunit Na+/H+ antiporter MnhB subunit
MRSNISNNSFFTYTTSLKRFAALLVAGILLSFLAGMFHPEGALANDLLASFTEYARSEHWTTVHLGEFAGMALLITGRLSLILALDRYRYCNASANGQIGSLQILPDPHPSAPASRCDDTPALIN